MMLLKEKTNLITRFNIFNKLKKTKILFFLNKNLSENNNHILMNNYLKLKIVIDKLFILIFLTKVLIY